MKKLHGNIKNLTGQRFGKLLVLYPTDKRSNRSVVWHCICDCGREADIASKNLIYGATHSCGCAYSIGEINIANILDSNNIHYKKEYCVIINNKKLRYDFAIYDNDNNIVRLIEFDGPHHTKPQTMLYSKEKCLITQQHDKEKNEWAINYNIPLVRIPYSKRDKITLEMIMGNQYLI